MSKDMNEDLRRAIGADQIPHAVDLLATAQGERLRKAARCEPSEISDMRERCEAYGATIDALLIIRREVLTP
jgi:hypothetical protein